VSGCCAAVAVVEAGLAAAAMVESERVCCLVDLAKWDSLERVIEAGAFERKVFRHRR